MVATLERIAVPAKNPRVSFVIPQDVKERLEYLADQDHRTISNFVLKLIIEEIERAEKEGLIDSKASAS
jgi:predicted DNA-binding protein